MLLFTTEPPSLIYYSNNRVIIRIIIIRQMKKKEREVRYVHTYIHTLDEKKKKKKKKKVHSLKAPIDQSPRPRGTQTQTQTRPERLFPIHATCKKDRSEDMDYKNGSVCSMMVSVERKRFPSQGDSHQQASCKSK